MKLPSITAGSFRFENMAPLFEAPRNYSWRRDNPDEEVIQSLRRYQKNPSINRPSTRRRTVYLQPIGEMNQYHEEAVQVSKEVLEAFFQLPIIVGGAWASGCVPRSHWRASVLPGERWSQADGEYILDSVLLQKFPKEAVVLKALTTFDLWDGGSFNYVFGLGSLDSRVAVTSLWRLGDFQTSNRADIFRVVKTVVHEVCHAFSLSHCVEFDCCMNGSNDANEGDLQPIELCPSCLKKLRWNIGFDPLCHLVDMQRVCARWGFADAAVRYESLIAAATDISTYEGEAEFIISAHGDTNFSRSQIFRRAEWIYGTLDNFVGVKATMDACFNGGLNGARIEITYGEEIGMAGALEVAQTVSCDDVVVVVDVTGYQTTKDLIIENCRSAWMYAFIKEALTDAPFTYDIFSDSGDPICQVDETGVYAQRTERCVMLAIPCDGGDYNSHLVRCRSKSLRSATSALEMLFAHFLRKGRPGMSE
jgi:archaemetzincin